MNFRNAEKDQIEVLGDNFGETLVFLASFLSPRTAAKNNSKYKLWENTLIRDKTIHFLKDKSRNPIHFKSRIGVRIGFQERKKIDIF